MPIKALLRANTHQGITMRSIPGSLFMLFVRKFLPWCDKQAVWFFVLFWFFFVSVGQNYGLTATCSQTHCPKGLFDSPLLFGGWVELGIYADGDDNRDHGPFDAQNQRRNDFQMNQLYLFGERTMNTKRGFDWGARADIVYGTDAPGMQCYGDEDFDWATDEYGYGLAAYQLFGTLGYKDLSVKIGKFGAPLGLETAASKDNFFYSYSNSYSIKPTTHTGILTTYDLTRRLSLKAGWTTGENSSFKSTQKSSSLLTGFVYELPRDASLHYGFNSGTKKNVRDSYFVQSLCLEWKPVKRLTHVIQYDLRNTKDERGNMWFSAYGVNNHLRYRWNERWDSGLRFEWLRNNGDYVDKCSGDYYQITLGLNWRPYKHVSIKPEIRSDWFRGTGTPFARGTQRSRVTGGCGLVLSF